MPEVACEERSGAKVGTEEAEVVPVAEGTGAPGGRSWLRRGGARVARAGRWRRGPAGRAQEGRRSQGRTSPHPPWSGGGGRFWCRR